MLRMVVIIILIFSSKLCFSEERTERVASTAATFLRIGIGARQAGMGEAFCSVCDDVNAIQWNAAGLSQIRRKETSFMQNFWVQDMGHQYISYCQPFYNGAVGFALSYLNYGRLERRDEWGVYLDSSFTPYSLIGDVSCGQELFKNLSLGFNIKGIIENIDLKSSQSVAFDLGALYKIKNSGVCLGLNIQNLGLEIEGFSLPINLKLGSSYKLPIHKDHSLLFAVDVNTPLDNNIKMNLGGEYWYRNIAALRVGYKIGYDEETLTCGFGVMYRDYQLDYAFTPYNELGNSHKLSFLWRIGEPKLKVKERLNLLKEDREKAIREADLEREKKLLAEKEAKKKAEEERLSTKGWGEEKPIATNKTPEGRAKNRRVEIVILHKEGGD